MSDPNEGVLNIFAKENARANMRFFGEICIFFMGFVPFLKWVIFFGVHEISQFLFERNDIYVQGHSACKLLNRFQMIIRNDFLENFIQTYLGERFHF